MKVNFGSPRRKLTWAAIATLLLSSGYCLARYRLEQGWLYREAHQIVDRAGARTRREQVMALRDHVRRNVRYQGAPHDVRPFLRATAQETLQSGRGYCGEATRAFINLAWQFGIRAHRVNLHGRISHVVAEVEVRPGHYILVDPQDNPAMRGYFDERDLELDNVVGCPSEPFNDYSNINLRRMPIVACFVQRVRLKDSWLTWTLENPWLIRSGVFFLISSALSWFILIDRALIRIYAYRLGVRLPSRSPALRPPGEIVDGVPAPALTAPAKSSGNFQAPANRSRAT